MIFATTGTQVPFDRFVRIVDEITADIDEEVLVQAFPDKYVPKNVQLVRFLNPDEFDRILSEARIVVAHAGIGTIVSALMKEKPLIIFPRIASLGEHRNEHQLATAAQMERLGYAYVASDESQLRSLIVNSETLHPLHSLGAIAAQSLIDSVSAFIESPQNAGV